MGKGSSTTTSQSTSAPDPQAYAAYSQLLQRAQGVASTPYQAYTGELTAPVNAQQSLGISGINANANSAQPAVGQALGLASGAANPLTASQIANYQNPYTQSVVNATQAEFNNQNAQAQQGLTSNAIAQGALGGNRVGVAQGIMAGQQALAQAPVIAGLNQQGYQQALQTAQQQYQQNPLAAAGAIANFGISGQNAALSGAGAQLGAGTLQQQTQQAQDAALYGQYQQAQAFPYQQTQWLAGLDTGVGSNMGGTSNGTTTSPAPNPLTQWLGLGAAGLGLAGQSGVFSGSPSYGGGNMLTDAYGGSSSNPLPGLSPSDYGVGYARGGAVQHMATGGVSGVPWSGGEGWIPSVQVHGGSGPPHASAPSVPSQSSSSFDPSKVMEGVGKILPFMGLKNGGVAGYADGGSPDFSARFSPAVDDPFGDMTRGQGLALATYGGLGVAAPPAPADSNAPVYDDGQGPVRLYGQRPTGNATALKATGVAASDEGETEAPDEATPTRGVFGASGVAPAAAFTPPYQITPGDYSKASAPTANPWAALTTAGLSMLANKSPFLGVGVGEGALAGLQAYGSAEEKDRKAAEDAEKLSLEAKKAANDLAHQTFTTNEQARHNKATEENASDKAPSGYQKKDDGTLAYIKGGPHDPEIIAAETNARTKKGTEIDDDTVDAIAQRVAQGDTRAVIGLGRNPTAIAQIQKRTAEIFKEQGLSHEEGAKAILANIADQAGRTTAERTQAGIAAKLAVYGRNVDNAIGVATKASAESNRTQFTPVNVAINAFKTNTGDPKIVALGQSLNTLTNEYARAIGSGHGTVHDKEQAETQLNQARSHEQLVAIMNVMRQEIQMTKKSMPEARQEMRELYGHPSSETMRPASASPELPATFNPPPGAIPQTHNGKTYYYDPNTKQPFPGQ